MSENNATNTTDNAAPDAAASTAAPDTATPQNATPQGESTDWKAEARKWETRAKADHDAAKQWREYEQSQKSEHEKLADELAAAKAAASQASATLLRYEIAAEKGISGAALDLLTGSTREELAANADKLLSLIADQSQTKPTLKPDVNQGKPATGTTQITSREVLAGMTPAEIMDAKKNGLLDSLLGKSTK